MKSLKKTLVLLVVLSMILSAVSPVFAFNDVISEDYAEQANKMGAFGVFAGDAEGNFKAEENITRAEMAVIIGKLMGLTANEADANKGYASNFSDVAAGDWYTGWVNLVAGRGIISGFPDGTFRPNEKVTQAQAVTMIVKALGWGVVVDQTGTWPANYITKASELRLFKNAVETNSELVTRGNVAIYCYNALTAKTWDVTESTNGELTSSAKDTDTILEKYFSDFTNEAGKMKLVEEAYVALSGANTTEIGKNQVKLVAVDTTSTDNIASFINAERSPKKGKDVVTYKDGAAVVAYVPTEVADIASLAGRKVDVIFGADNEVAYIVVTDDSVEGVYVTAFENDEIEIDGEEYEFASDAVVAVYGHKLPMEEDETAADVVKALLGTVAALEALEEDEEPATDVLYCLNSKNELTRNVIAEFILNEDDEIESLNLKFSVGGFDKVIQAYVAATEGTEATEDTPAVPGTPEIPEERLVINEFIVEKISAKNVMTISGNDSRYTDLDDYEDAEPRVIKNGEVAEVADIEVGDVVTEVVYAGKVEVMIVVANAVEGDVADYVAKTNTIEVDGTDYKVVAAPVYNEEGETDEYSNPSNAATLYDTFEDETVTIYLNMAGEIVAMVGESEATGTILGVVTDAAEIDYTDDDVEYIKVRILAEDGSEKRYSIYNKKSGKDVSADEENYGVYFAEADELVDDEETDDVNEDENDAVELKVGSVVMFSADADRAIKSDDIKIVTENATGIDFKVASDVELKIVDASALVANIDDNKLVHTYTEDEETVAKTYRKNSSTIIFNSYTDNEELISWEAFTHKAVGTDTEAAEDDAYTNNLAIQSGNVYLFLDGSTIVYAVASINEEHYGASDTQYGIVIDVRRDKDEDDETIYVATILVDGVEKEIECSSTFRSTVDEGNFISFDVSDGEIDTYNKDLIKSTVSEYIADLTGDTINLTDYTTLAAYQLEDDETMLLDAITVDSVETDEGVTYLVFEDVNAAEVDLAENYVVYDLEAQEMADEINEGDYVLVIDTDPEDGYEIVVVL